MSDLYLGPSMSVPTPAKSVSVTIRQNVEAVDLETEEGRKRIALQFARAALSLRPLD